MKKTILAALAIAGFAGLNNAGAVTSFAQNDAVMFFYIQQSASTFSYNDLSIVSSTFGANWYNNPDLFVGIIQATATSALTSFQNPDQYTSLQINRIFAKENAVITQLNKGSISGINGSAATAMAINVGPGIAANYTLIDDVTQTTDVNQIGFAGWISGQLGQAMTGGGQDIGVFTYNATANDGTQLGTVSISSTGDVTAVPEPSAYALMGVGALLLIVAYRRKANS